MNEYRVMKQYINKNELLEELYKIDDGDNIDISTNDIRDIIKKLPVYILVKMKEQR